MPTVIFVHPNGKREAVDVAEGLTIMQAATGHGLEEILAECGGNAMCATCHVYVDGDQLGRLPKMSEEEDALLEGTASERLPNSRLGCQIKMTSGLDGLVVSLPERQV
jgi:2Fe-2S ferredoxin